MMQHGSGLAASPWVRNKLEVAGEEYSPQFSGRGRQSFHYVESGQTASLSCCSSSPRETERWIPRSDPSRLVWEAAAANERLGPLSGSGSSQWRQGGHDNTHL